MNTSEWVSIGHPDKIADYISSYLLDRYLERDPDTRFAVEVQIKDKFVTLGGEVTSKAWFTHEELERSVHEAVAEIGYTEEYRDKWGGDNTIYDEEIEIAYHLSQQSPDIARGVDNGGWGDQGIFWGMAVNNPETRYMPLDWSLARGIGRTIFYSGIGGLDVKTQVSVENGKAVRLIVAVPVLNDEDGERLRKLVTALVPDETEITINGTGSYKRHGPIGDCGTTGRKLVVDFYGGNCRIGGGSPWTKDGSKADLSLNLYARLLAYHYLLANSGIGTCYCAISCCIGKPEITIDYFDGRNELIESKRQDFTPTMAASLFRLKEPRFAEMCREGLFSWMPRVGQFWDNSRL